jgi:hypothetical protein
MLKKSQHFGGKETDWGNWFPCVVYLVGSKSTLGIQDHLFHIEHVNFCEAWKEG